MSFKTKNDFCFEELESRELLAGNVLVAVVGGDLEITGDNQPNEFRVVDNETGGQFVLALNGTKLNGETNGSFNTGPITNLKIDANGGDDVFVLRVSNLSGDIDILGDRGNDNIQIVQSEFNNVVLRGGIGNDFVKIA